ncbi:MAG: hypothetical protein GEU68_15710 [Actinobacteria bacterium]|nr:hypothetical protein [Actinomycetota bacterium]
MKPHERKGRRTEARLSARRKRTALVLGGVVAAAIFGVAAFSGGQRGGTSVQGTAALEQPAPEVTLTDSMVNPSRSRATKVKRPSGPRCSTPSPNSV